MSPTSSVIAPIRKDGCPPGKNASHGGTPPLLEDELLESLISDEDENADELDSEDSDELLLRDDERELDGADEDREDSEELRLREADDDRDDRDDRDDTLDD